MCSNLTDVRDAPLARILSFLTLSNDVKCLLAIGSKQLNSNIFSCPLASVIMENGNNFQKSIIMPWLFDDACYKDYVDNRVAALHRNGNAVPKWVSHFKRVKHANLSWIHLNDIPSNISSGLTSLECSEVALMVTLLSANKNGTLLRPLAELFPNLTSLNIVSDCYQVRFGWCFPMEDCLILEGSKLPEKLQTLESSCRDIEFCSLSQLPSSLTSIEMPRTVVTPNIMRILPPGLIVLNVSFRSLPNFGNTDVLQAVDQLFASKTWASLLPRSLRHLMLCIRLNVTQRDSRLHCWTKIAGLKNLPPLLETASFKGFMLFPRSAFDTKFDIVDEYNHTSPQLTAHVTATNTEAKGHEVRSIESHASSISAPSSSSHSSSSSLLLFGEHIKNIYMSLDVTDYPNVESEHFKCTNCYCDKSAENIRTILKEVCDENLYSRIIFPQHFDIATIKKIIVVSTESTSLARLAVSPQEFVSFVNGDMVTSKTIPPSHWLQTVDTLNDYVAQTGPWSHECSIKHSCKAMRFYIQDHRHQLPTKCSIDYENWDLQTTPHDYHLVGSKSSDFAEADSKPGLATHKCNKTHCNVVLSNRLSEVDMCSSRNSYLWTNVIAWEGSNITSLEISVLMLKDGIFYSNMMPPLLKNLMVLYPNVYSGGRHRSSYSPDHFTFEHGALAKVKNTLSLLEIDRADLEYRWLNEIGANVLGLVLTDTHRYPDFEATNLPPCNLYNPNFGISVTIIHEDALSASNVDNMDNSRRLATFVTWLTTSHCVELISLVTPISNALNQLSFSTVKTKKSDRVSTKDWYLRTLYEDVDMLMENKEWRVMRNITYDTFITVMGEQKKHTTGKSVILLFRIGRSNYSEGLIYSSSSSNNASPSSVAQLNQLLFNTLKSCEDNTTVLVIIFYLVILEIVILFMQK